MKGNKQEIATNKFNKSKFKIDGKSTVKLTDRTRAQKPRPSCHPLCVHVYQRKKGQMQIHIAQQFKHTNLFDRGPL